MHGMQRKQRIQEIGLTLLGSTMVAFSPEIVRMGDQALMTSDLTEKIFGIDF